MNGTTTGFWYDGNDIYAELSGATPSFAYVRGLSIDEPYIRKGASDEFYHADGLGTAFNLSDSTGTKTRTYTYEPFGTTVGSGTASTNTLQFTGRENDGTNLYYYRARYYHPKFQRFMGEDPTGLGGGDINLYAYVRNNPLRFVDPRGLTWETNSEFFWDWVFGSGAAFRFYDPNSIQTTEMRTSEAAEMMRDLFNHNGCRDTLKINYGTLRAYWDTATNPSTADLSSTAFQVGGFAGASVVNNGNGTATFNVRNVAGAHSFFYHIVPDVPWDNGPMRNVTQSFTWTEPIPCLGHRK
jgi:RHS repeat-associated protein